MEPATEHHVCGKGACETGEVRKDVLGNVFCEMGIALDPPEGRRIDQIDVAGHQLAECRFRGVSDVFGEQCSAVRHFNHQ